MLVFDASSIIRVPEVLHLPCPINFFRQGIVEVPVEQENVILAVSGFSELCSYVFLRSLRLSEQDRFLRYAIIPLV